MTALESVLRRAFEGRARRWSIITVNALLALALGLPAVDEYFAQRRRESELSAQLEQAERQLQRAAELRNRVTAVALELDRMEKRALLDAGEQEYRQSLVQSVRKSGCQLRQLTLEKPLTRDWNPEDDPLGQPKQRPKVKDRGDATFGLRTQGVALSVSGTMEEARTFLKELQAGGTLIHVTQLSMRPNGRSRTNVIVELQYQLFGLKKQAAPFPSA